MHWAARRRLAIVVILGAVGFGLFIIASFAAFYRAPTCADGKQNQDESGVDCGGACSYVCTADAVAPVTLFTNLIHTKSGRTDLIAAVENRNGDAVAKDVPFIVTLYTANGTVIDEVRGSLDLPPRTIVPIFIPRVVPDTEQVSRAFLKIEPEAPQWERMSRDPRILPLVEVKPLGGTTAAPRVLATLTNPSITLMGRVPVVAFVRDSSTGNVIAASQTVVQTIPPQGSATALFTWSEPFAAAAVRIEVVPIIALP
jgi:hypothetical protein